MKPSGSSPAYEYPGSRHCQFGVSRRRESHRCVRHELAISPRSSTTWSMARSERHLLIASPPWPAPMTTVVVRTATALSRARWSGSAVDLDLDLDVGRIGDDVVYRRPLLRLGD